MNPATPAAPASPASPAPPAPPRPPRPPRPRRPPRPPCPGRLLDIPSQPARVLHGNNEIRREESRTDGLELFEGSDRLLRGSFNSAVCRNRRRPLLEGCRIRSWTHVLLGDSPYSRHARVLARRVTIATRD